MEVVEGAVCGALIAVGAGTGIAADGGVDQLEVDVVLDLGVELAEALDEAVGLPVVGLKVKVEVHLVGLDVFEGDLQQNVDLCVVLQGLPLV